MPNLLNPVSAQRTLLAGKALVDQPQLAVFAVRGEQRLEWLHSLLSQNIKNLTAGQSVESLALDANGHIEHLIRIFEDGENTWLITERSGADALLLWLRKMVFRSKVTVPTELSNLAVVASWDAPVATPAPVLSWVDGWSQTAPGGFRYATAPEEPWALVLNVLDPAAHAGLLADPAVEWAPEAALDALRIAAHRPSVAELDEKSIPHELDLLASAVHLSKGCYRGQETVAKVHNLGHPPRRLVLLHLDGSNHVLPEPGSDVLLRIELGGEPAAAKGHVTSVAQHHEMGPIALAVISRNVPAEAALVVTGHGEPVAANQELIVPLDAGKVANLPRPGMLGRPRR